MGITTLQINDYIAVLLPTIEFTGWWWKGHLKLPAIATQSYPCQEAKRQPVSTAVTSMHCVVMLFVIVLFCRSIFG